MAEYLIQDTTLDAIADAINAKTGKSAAMTPAEMVTEIGSIQTGGGVDISPYSVSKGTIELISNGKITIPTPNIDSTQFVAVFFMIQNYATVAAEQFALGNKVSFGARFISFSEYRTASGLAKTDPLAQRYGVDNTALNYYSSVGCTIGTESISFDNPYFRGTYDYVAIYKEVTA